MAVLSHLIACLPASRPDSGLSAHAPSNNALLGTGWSSVVNYTRVVLTMPLKVPIGGMYRPWITISNTARSVPTTRHRVFLDANFHAAPAVEGVVVRNATGTFNGQLPMNLTELLGASANGWHKLGMQGKVLDPQTGATHTGSLAVYFEVANGAADVDACGAGPIMTHAASDATLTVSKRTGAATVVTVGATVSGGATITPTKAVSRGTNQRAVVLTYDLSFLQAPSGLAAASLWVFVEKDGGLAGAKVQAFAAEGAAPCVGAGCTAVGSATLTASDHWTEVVLNPAYVLSKMRGGKSMSIALALAAVSEEAVVPVSVC